MKAVALPAAYGVAAAQRVLFGLAELGRAGIETGSQNPVGYCDLEEERVLLQRPCACGCDATSNRDFLPGHDVRAIQQRVKDRFGGSPLKLIQFIDEHAPDAATAA